MNHTIKLVVRRDGAPVLDKKQLKTTEWTAQDGSRHTETYFLINAWESKPNSHNETHYLTQGKTDDGKTRYCGSMYENKPQERPASEAEQQTDDIF